MWNELVLLFCSGFISSTLFPGGSELLFVYFLQDNPDNMISYFVAITVGNSFGAIATYFMGYYLYWGRNSAQKNHQKAWQACQRYGAFTLLFSWVPVVGDLLPLAAGWLKLAIIRSLIFIFAGKAIRYSIIIIFVEYFL